MQAVEKKIRCTLKKNTHEYLILYSLMTIKRCFASIVVTYAKLYFRAKTYVLTRQCHYSKFNI